LKTPIRRLDGISYWVIEDPDAIYDFVNTELRKEWEEDAKSEGRDPKQDVWLNALPKHRWTLEITNIDQIKPDPRIMNYTDADRGYIFRESLSKRSQELKETIEKFASVIWPVIVKKEDFMLVDGYCRYTALKALHVSGTYAYVGSL
jgi:hypothetical protein